MTSKFKTTSMRGKPLVIYLEGYRLLYLPDHPKAMKSNSHKGYVYEHVVVAEKCIGRQLRDNEVVHHLDLSRDNNRSENLLVLENGQHIKLHIWLDKVKLPKSSTSVEVCEVCQITLQGNNRYCCSRNCLRKSSRSQQVKRKTGIPSKEELQDDINKMCWVSIGKKYKVSDNAVRKWARAYGLPTKGLSRAKKL